MENEADVSDVSEILILCTVHESCLRIPLCHSAEHSTPPCCYTKHCCYSTSLLPVHLSVKFLPTFFSDGIQRLHAALDVVSDMTVEQPGTRILRTHFHRLEKISTLGSLHGRG